ncbi:MAG: PQQ-binding-like beta-propeller repeat protein, partial [Polyangiaceae bacterium]
MAAEIGHFEKVRALASGNRVVVVGGIRAGSASQVTAFEPGSNKRVWSADVPAHVLSAWVLGELVLCGCSDGEVRALKAAGGELAWSVTA